MTPLMVQGQRLRGQYYPLSSKQLEWQLSLNAGAKEVQREQARITQVIHTFCHPSEWIPEKLYNDALAILSSCLVSE